MLSPTLCPGTSHKLTLVSYHVREAGFVMALVWPINQFHWPSYTVIGSEMSTRFQLVQWESGEGELLEKRNWVWGSGGWAGRGKSEAGGGCHCYAIRACLGRAGKVSGRSQNSGDSNIIGAPESSCTTNRLPLVFSVSWANVLFHKVSLMWTSVTQRLIWPWSVLVSMVVTRLDYWAFEMWLHWIEQTTHTIYKLDFKEKLKINM